MDSSLEQVEFLARSESRIRVLETIDEEPRDRRELKEQTDVSRYTLSRILADFEDREWIVRTGQEYELTGLGSLVNSEVESLLANLRVGEELNGALDWLPTEQFEFDIACLGDAEVITPTETDHTAPIRRAADLIHEADRFRGIATGVAYEVMEAIRDRAVHDDLALECILDASTFDAVRDDGTLRTQFREIAESEGAAVFEYCGPDPVVMMISGDDTVLMCGHAEQGPPPGTIETAHPEVRSWAETYFDSVLEKSRPVDVDEFGAEQPRTT